jgi:hypothetical protein
MGFPCVFPVNTFTAEEAEFRKAVNLQYCLETIVCVLPVVGIMALSKARLRVMIVKAAALLWFYKII